MTEREKRALEARIDRLERSLDTTSQRQARALGYPPTHADPDDETDASTRAAKRLRGD